MCISAWDSRSDRYERIPVQVVLKDNRYFSFHPLSENQLDGDSAFEDALDLRDPYLLAESLLKKMESSHMNDRHFRIFIGRFIELLAGR